MVGTLHHLPGDDDQLPHQIGQPAYFLDWTKDGMFQLDYFSEEGLMVEWVKLMPSKMQFNNTLSRECTGINQ